MSGVPRFIAVEGPIGVGKTTLARRLADRLDASLLLERAEDNPFLVRFYREPRTAALPAQLFFLFQRARQATELRQQDIFRPLRVADFLLDKDRLFARVTLNDDEYRLYEQVYQRVTMEAPVPDLVLYLQAPVSVLMDRVRRRGIDYERHISDEYLERLSQAYMDFFLHYDDAPLLIVNTENLDLASGRESLDALMHKMEGGLKGRHYFNTTPLERAGGS